MGVFKKLFSFLTLSDKNMVSLATHRQLVELHVPSQQWHGERAQAVAHLAEKRLITEAPGSARTELLLWGLEHRSETVRHACAERLAGIDTPEITAALVRHLDDTSHHVRFQATLHLEHSANRFHPRQVAATLETLRLALPLEPDQLARKCLQDAGRRLEGL